MLCLAASIPDFSDSAMAVFFEHVKKGWKMAMQCKIIHKSNLSKVRIPTYDCRLRF